MKNKVFFAIAVLSLILIGIIVWSAVALENIILFSTQFFIIIIEAVFSSSIPYAIFMSVMTLLILFPLGMLYYLLRKINQTVLEFGFAVSRDLFRKDIESGFRQFSKFFNIFTYYIIPFSIYFYLKSFDDYKGAVYFLMPPLLAFLTMNFCDWLFERLDKPRKKMYIGGGKYVDI